MPDIDVVDLYGYNGNELTDLSKTELSMQVRLAMSAELFHTLAQHWLSPCCKWRLITAAYIRTGSYTAVMSSHTERQQ